MNKKLQEQKQKTDLQNIRLTAKGKKVLNEWLKKVSPRFLEMRNEYPELADEINVQDGSNSHYMMGYYEGFAHGKIYFDKAVAYLSRDK